jgi:hypothetical protein
VELLALASAAGGGAGLRENRPKTMVIAVVISVESREIDEERRDGGYGGRV